VTTTTIAFGLLVAALVLLSATTEARTKRPGTLVSRLATALLCCLACVSPAAAQSALISLPLDLRKLPQDINRAAVSCHLQDASGRKVDRVGGAWTSDVARGGLSATANVFVENHAGGPFKDREGTAVIANRYVCELRLYGATPDGLYLFFIVPSTRVTAAGWSGRGGPTGAIRVFMPAAARPLVIAQGVVPEAFVAALGGTVVECPCGCGATVGEPAACTDAGTASRLELPMPRRTGSVNPSEENPKSKVDLRPTPNREPPLSTLPPKLERTQPPPSIRHPDAISFRGTGLLTIER
jgi:hypothetical protein